MCVITWKLIKGTPPHRALICCHMDQMINISFRIGSDTCVRLEAIFGFISVPELCITNIVALPVLVELVNELNAVMFNRRASDSNDWFSFSNHQKIKAPADGESPRPVNLCIQCGG